MVNPRSKFEALVQSAFRELLEGKHLYQSVQINADSLIPDESDGTPQFARGEVRRAAIQLFLGTWDIHDPQGRSYLPNMAGADHEPQIRVIPPDVKLYCTRCSRREAFNLYSAEDFTARGTISYADSPFDADRVQVFVLSFQCQSCKNDPEVFMIRRHKLRIALCGRAPMEFVEVPNVIPKPHRRYYSDALVAFNSGQVLAALFLLRTLIEQWVYASLATGSSGLKADEALDAYMTSLPEDFRGRFPSIRQLYSDLSAAIHSADSSEELFARARDELVQHFDARRLFALLSPM